MKAKNSRLFIDGRLVRCWLFAHKSPLSGHPVLAQVEAFNIDHAVKRLESIYPMIPRAEWNMIEELDAEHDVGALGRKHPLLSQLTAPRRLQ